jgi:hypothetical protein
VAPFDTTVTSAPIKLDEPPLSFRNPRRVTQGHQDYFNAYVDRGDGNGVRPPLQLPVVNILGITSPSPGVPARFPIELNAGDALIIEAAQQPHDLGPPIFPTGLVPNSSLNARLYINGTQVTPHAGSVQSNPTVDGSGISFNYVSD